MLQRRYFSDTASKRWWIKIDADALARAKEIGVDLTKFTVVDLAAMMAELLGPKPEDDERPIIRLLGVVKLSKRPQYFTVDIATLIRAVTAFCHAMDDAKLGTGRFYHHWKTKMLANFEADALTSTTATKA